MMNIKQHICRGVILSLVFVFQFACDAPHKNPLDPQNPDALWSELRGSARMAGSPAAFVADVTVIWNGERVTHSDAQGAYVFERLRPVDGWLHYFKNGFRPDSVFIAWGGRKRVEQDILLRPLPTLQGHVKTMRVPPQPIADVKVTWGPEQQFVYTDAQGFYRFENLDSKPGQLLFEKDGYRSAVEDIEWSTGSVITTNVFLNANPTLDSLLLYSVVEHHYGPRIVEQMIVRAYIQDAEGDINAVSIECSPLDIDEELLYNVQHKRFERSFSVNDL